MVSQTATGLGEEMQHVRCFFAVGKDWKSTYTGFVQYPITTLAADISAATAMAYEYQ